MLLLLASMAFADISPVNTRPVTIGTGPASELTLQEILDTIYGSGVKNDEDQEKAGIWGLPGPGTDISAPILRFEEAGNAGTNIFGIWSGHDLNAMPTMVPIFDGPASPDTIATLSWVGGDPNTVHITQVTGTGVNAGQFAGINRYWFGFYLQQGPAGPVFYTADQLNGGNAQAVTYVGPGNKWTFAFEDQPIGSSDRDFNDLVVTAESITPAPDGGVTILLLGGALMGLETLRRRFYV
jgi:hypothetical protein